MDGALNGDLVVEVGAACVDIDRMAVYPQINKIVHQRLTPKQAQSWVFTHTTLTPADVEISSTSDYSVRTLLKHYEDRTWTSYNVAFDFGRFMDHAPWNFKPHMAPCIKEAYGEYNGGIVTAQAAYDKLCPDNPARLPGGREEHRALSDAIMEGYILLRLLDASQELRRQYLEAAA